MGRDKETEQCGVAVLRFSIVGSDYFSIDGPDYFLRPNLAHLGEKARVTQQRSDS